MGVKTIHTCERCGKESMADSPYGSQYYFVGISFRKIGYASNNAERNSQLWCRNCCDEFQIITDPQGTSKEPAPPVITTEDKIIMLLEELGFRREE